MPATKGQEPPSLSPVGGTPTGAGNGCAFEPSRGRMQEPADRTRDASHRLSGFGVIARMQPQVQGLRLHCRGRGPGGWAGPCDGVIFSSQLQAPGWVNHTHAVRTIKFCYFAHPPQDVSDDRWRAHPYRSQRCRRRPFAHNSQRGSAERPGDKSPCSSMASGESRRLPQRDQTSCQPCDQPQQENWPSMYTTVRNHAGDVYHRPFPPAWDCPYPGSAMASVSTITGISRGQRPNAISGGSISLNSPALRGSVKNPNA